MPVPVTRFTIIVSGVFLLPWLVLLVLGGYWLWQHDWLYRGLAILSANFALTYCLLYWRRQRDKPVFLDTVVIEPNPNWPDNAQPIWLELEPLAERWQKEANVLTDASKVWQLTMQDTSMPIQSVLFWSSRYRICLS